MTPDAGRASVPRMALYRSSTRELALAELPPKLGASVAEHAARHQLELGAVRCWLTRSENPIEEGMMGKLFGRRANSADPDAEHVTAVVLHPTHLLMGTEGKARGVAVLSVPLGQASVTRGHPALEKLGAVAAEPGMQIDGLPGEHGRPGSYFVKLGEDADGAACFGAVRAAIVAAKNR